MREFIRQFRDAADALGIENLYFYIETIWMSSVEIVGTQPWLNRQSQMTGMNIQGTCDGRSGSIYVENMDLAAVEEEARSLKDVIKSAKVLARPDMSVRKETIEEGTSETEIIELSDRETLTEQLVQAKERAIQENKECTEFPHFRVEEVVRKIEFGNGVGERPKEIQRYVRFEAVAKAERGNLIQTAQRSVTVQSISEIDFYREASLAAARACEMLGAESAKTGTYLVVLDASVVCEMLSIYWVNFAGDRIRQKRSKYVGKSASKIAASCVNLIEDPHLLGGVNNRDYDDEGVATSYKNIVEQGILKGFIYNREEAVIGKCKSTGNGFKRNYKDETGIYFTNLKLTGQDKTLEELLKKTESGLYITSCNGMFAGADPVSGDFSVISKGYRIENGRIGQGVHQFTIAGNFYSMLQEIEALGNDYHRLKAETGAYVAPSVCVKSLVVSGN